MLISWSQLEHLPVQTETGQKVGVVAGVTVDVDNHAVVRYEIKPGLPLLSFFSRTLLVSPAQVVSISDQVMIVKDAILLEIPQTGTEKTRLALGPESGEIEV